MGRATRPKPERLAEKLKRIRQKLGYSQTEMLINLGYSSDKKDFRSIISAYELGKREPTLIDLLSYARLSDVTVESIIDDEMELFFDSNFR
jgi:transcriptional regulator with XRE-family HTH domain